MSALLIGFLLLLYANRANSQDCSQIRDCAGHGECIDFNVCLCESPWFAHQSKGCDINNDPLAPAPAQTTAAVAPMSPALVANISTLTRAGDTPRAALEQGQIILLAIGATIVCLCSLLCCVLCLICQLRPNSSVAQSYRARFGTFGLSKRNQFGGFDDEFFTAPGTTEIAFVRQLGAEIGSAPNVDGARPPRESYRAVSDAIDGKSGVDFSGVLAAGSGAGGAPLPTAVALWDFNGTSSGDLVFKAGERITVLQHANKWWEGRLNGKVGVFPSNYVQLVQSAWTPPKPKLERDLPRAPRQLGRKSKVVKKCKALYDFTGEQANDLSFLKDDVITVTAWHESWWTGMCDRTGEEGVFPRNYVQMMTKSSN